MKKVHDESSQGEWVVVPEYTEEDKQDFQDHFIYYKVQQGDSLLKISLITGISKKLLSESNYLMNDYLIEGMSLKIPKNKLKKDELLVIEELGLDKNNQIN